MNKIQVLGPGCPKCKKLVEVAGEAVQKLGLECTVEKVTDIREIMTFGVMMTPALVVDGKVVLTGRVPTVAEAQSAITSALT
jgi:small redox-active disulfide protein 2